MDMYNFLHSTSIEILQKYITGWIFKFLFIYLIIFYKLKIAIMKVDTFTLLIMEFIRYVFINCVRCNITWQNFTKIYSILENYFVISFISLSYAVKVSSIGFILGYWLNFEPNIIPFGFSMVRIILICDM